MSRKLIYGLVKVCQQLPDPLHGIGTGGNRCEPTCAAILDCSYKIGKDAQAGKDPQAIMQDFARWRNNGALSGPPEPPWLGDWLKSRSGGKIYLQPIPSTFEAIKPVIDAGNVIYAGLDFYMRQKDFAGADPYTWKEDPTLPEGHVEIIMGYDDNFRGKYGQTVGVNDPLQGTLTKQPWDYSFASLLQAGLHLYRVVGPALKVTDESPLPQNPPPPVPDPVEVQLAKMQAFQDAVDKWLLAAPQPPK